MPSDIRSFFTPKGGNQSSQKKSAAPAASPSVNAASKVTKKTAGRKRVVADSDDEDEEEPTPAKKTTTKKPPAKAPKVEEEVDASAYFGGRKKVERAPPVKSSKTPVKKEVKPEPITLEDDNDEADDIFAETYAKKEDDYVDEEMEEDEPVKPTRKTPTRAAAAPKTPTKGAGRKKDLDIRMKDADEDDDFEPEEDEEDVKPKPRGTKRKSVTESDEDDEPVAKGRKAPAKSTPSKPPAKKRAPAKPKAAEPEIDSEAKRIMDSIATVRPPTPPPADPDAEKKKFSYQQYMQRGTAQPPAAGTKEIPTGKENCLAGLTFVFTGLLDTLSREDGQQLVKRYGGKVTTAPSKKTSFVVLGNDAGPKKLETIKKNNIKTINEDGLFELIRKLPANGGDSKEAQKQEEKRLAEEKKIADMAEEMAREEQKRKAEEAKKLASAAPGPQKAAAVKQAQEAVNTESQLWTVKYAPTAMSQICGNKAPVERLQKWLKNWQKNLKSNFTKRGEDGSGIFRAVMIHGPPGIGKTTAAHLVAKLEGYDVVEYNASDTRSKKLMEDTLRGVLDNRSLAGYFSGGDRSVDTGKQRMLLVMDEVDGMSAGDRGGVGQLAAVCRKSSIPIICICNERRLPKMKPFDKVVFELPFRRPDAQAIRSRIASIAFREGMKLPPNVIDQLVEGTHSDIRQIINMLSTFGVNKNTKTMSFDESKAMSKAWEKHVILKPWDIASQLLGPQLFAPQSRKTLNDKIELYFNDHEFSYLMIQENYLKTNPSLSSGLYGKEKKLKDLELASLAAESISDGDLVDALIHGPQQQWSLMPVHGVFSTVRPSSYMYGGYGGQMFGFTTWLGNNSKAGKLSRFVKEIQSHMRLRTSGDRHEVRQSYLPTFWYRLAKTLEIEGADAVDKVIDLMDDYYLTKDDYDAIIELCVGPLAEGNLNIPSQVKSTFTRQYNQRSHPMPFMRASHVVGGPKMKKEVPDLEDAIPESDIEEDIEEAAIKEEEEEEDITKDKYIKQPKKKAAPKAAATTKAKAAPKTPAAKGKGRAKK
ncbi:DNA replication factor C, large subunit [Ascobolus immersus RN42]|uniref:Replication factor C subunit 1 n=1 Tax=Ascobolus immersus RN42 TaxID=1160509 RepID=A0A3N4IND6_ASCIM|nr:DNA replication factor C, large subunit [Ascobolus immersus RN42]